MINCESDLVAVRKRESNGHIINISDLIGSWGPFQKQLFTVIALIHCTYPFNNASIFYYSVKEDIICEMVNGTQIVIQPDKCSLVDLDDCPNWHFTSDRVTVSKEWTLICERYWLRSLMLSAYLMGQLIGAMIFGWISDRNGRKFAIKICLTIEIICDFCLTFVTNSSLFILTRVFHGIGGQGRSLSSIILIMESVDPRYRGKLMFYFDSLWHSFSFIMIGITYLVPSFRYIYMGTTIYQLCCLPLLKLLPESPRWQMISGQTIQAESMLKKFTFNRVSDSQFKEKFNELKSNLDRLKSIKKLGMASLFCYYRTAKLVTILTIVWSLRSVTTSGLHYCTLDLPGNLFINNAIISSFSFTSIILMTRQADKYRRRVLLITFFTINSFLFTFFSLFLTSTQTVTIKIIFVAVCSFCGSSIYCVLSIYTPEVFPTTVRNLGLGLCNIGSELGAITGPFINQLVSLTSLKVTFLALAVPSMVAGLIVIFLPETKGVEMPDTVEQMLLSDESTDVED